MTKNVSVQTFIRALLVGISIISIITFAYIVSYSSLPLVYDYESELRIKEQNIEEEADLAKKNSDRCSLMNIAYNLCELKLCEKDHFLATHYLVDLFKIIDGQYSESQRVQLFLFAGNIYRDCGQYNNSVRSYQRALADLNTLQNQALSSQNKKNKAIVLNNLGTTYYLMAKSAPTKNERINNFYAAKDFFEMANNFLAKNETTYLNKTIEKNIQQCLIELRFID